MKDRISAKDKQRLVFAFMIVAFLILLLCVRVGYIQVVKKDEYTRKAVAQQTKDELFYSKRGDIIDRNGQKMAISTVTYSVWLRPSEAMEKGKDKDGKIREVTVDNPGIKKSVNELSEILGVKPEDINKDIAKKNNHIKVAKGQENETVQKIKKAKIKGVQITEESKRAYPMKNFASQLLGSVTDDNNGLSGLEAYYNGILRGNAGRQIKSKDSSGRNLSYGNDILYDAEDGHTLKLTIDVVVQHYAEKAIKNTEKDIKGSKARCIVMNPKTGEILAMAASGGFDPNNSRIPVNKKDRAKFKKVSEKDQMKYANQMWRNPLVSDSYEPGSTFKLITTAMALEEDKTRVGEHFNCAGYLNVAGTRIRCWRSYNPHGYQSLTQAVGNSCNPVFMTLAQRIGIKKFYEYLGLFGFKESTGIDYPGEAGAIFQDEKTAGPVGLATIGFGQGISVTPIQLITAISSFANDGVMMKPRLVKEIRDSNGKVIKKYEEEEVRRPVSKETSKEILKMMEYVVKSGGAKKAQIDGYRVGGKTGTANKVDPKTGKYGQAIIGSFIGVAPIENPKIVVLYIVNDPSGSGFGSDIAAPGAKELMKNTLRYMNVPRSNGGKN